MKKLGLILALGILLGSCGGKDVASELSESDSNLRECGNVGCDSTKQYCFISQSSHYDQAAKKLNYSERTTQCVNYQSSRDCEALQSDATRRFNVPCSGTFSNQCQKTTGSTDIVVCSQLR